MADVFMALIALEDYEAFRRILKSHIAHTYDGWLRERIQQQTQFIQAGGIRLRQKKVRPDDFVLYYSARNMNPDIQVLDAFAREQILKEGCHSL